MTGEAAAQPAPVAEELPIRTPARAYAVGDRPCSPCRPGCARPAGPAVLALPALTTLPTWAAVEQTWRPPPTRTTPPPVEGW
nr:hypothetical protein [Streptomyces albospinus]